MSDHSPHRVSVVIPAYKVSNYIGATIESILAQTYRDFEILVVNDACPDSEALEKALEPYREQIRYFRQAKNAGPSAARNVGVEAARGDLIAFLDGDDLFDPRYLEVQVGMLRDNPEADMVYGSALLIGDDPCVGMPVSAFRPSKGPVTVESLLREQVSVLIMSVVRRETVLRAGGFDPAIRKCEDYDLWLRIAKGGGRIIYHAQPIGRYRMRGDSASVDTLDMCRHRFIVAEKFERGYELTPGERDALRDAKLRWGAEMEFVRSQHLFNSKHYREAAEHLDKANRYQRRTKYYFAGLLLRRVPQAVHLFVEVRDLFKRTFRRIPHSVRA